MAYHEREYKQLNCRDFGAECDFMVRAETEDEVIKYGYEHSCSVHEKCGISSESYKKMKSHIRSVWMSRS